MKAQIKHITDVACMGSTIEFTVVLDSLYRQDVFEVLNAMQGDKKPYTISIEPKKERRSLRANNYCWELCHKIGEKINAPKTVVYQKNIREVGSFTTLEMLTSSVPQFSTRWGGNGLGWLTDTIDQHGEYTSLIAYYGSSTYTTAEMSRLIDSVVSEAKSVGVETLPPWELDIIKAAWKGS